MKPSADLFRAIGLLLAASAASVTAPAYTFTLNSNTGLPVKWPAGTIPVTLMLGETPTLSDGNSFNSTARAAAQTWNAFLGSVQFQTTAVAAAAPSDRNGVNELGFAATVYGKEFGADVLAVTVGYRRGNQSIENDILFNNARTWDSYRGPLRSGAIDLQRVALHELGHVLGLDHPDEASPKQEVAAIMNSRISSRYELSDDDIQGAQQLYGPPGVPPNDNFANATPINLAGSPSVTLKGYNTNATKEAGDPRQGDNPGGRSVWWKWVAPSVGSVTLDTKGSYFDTTLGVYTGTSLASLAKVVDNDDIDPGVVQASSVAFTTTAGTTYWIDVDGFNNIEQDRTDRTGADNGGITLNLNFSGSLGTAPVITTQPASLTVTAGNSASFSVTATGTEPLSYQWLFNGVAINGATAASYTIASAGSGNAGSYSVTVSNAAGSVTSNPATLTVNPVVTTPPPSSGGGGGGGGGAPSLWFAGVLAVLAALHRLGRHARP